MVLSRHILNFFKKIILFRVKNRFFDFTFILFYGTILGTNTKHLPVAQLDSASDSDSEGQRFESVRVGQNKRRGLDLRLMFCSTWNGTEKLATRIASELNAVELRVQNPFRYKKDVYIKKVLYILSNWCYNKSGLTNRRKT